MAETTRAQQAAMLLVQTQFRQQLAIVTFVKERWLGLVKSLIAIQCKPQYTSAPLAEQ